MYVDLDSCYQFSNHPLSRCKDKDGPWQISVQNIDMYTTTYYH